jgi:prepilin-type N-terminal cleavage/methylation domain-containing protein/prepilin-type processing-associated H-X9-DG protein
VKRGFSLIELLMTLAIVALLASLIAPALSRAKDQARQAACLNNLRQLGIAAQLYWDDHEGRAFPYRGASTNNGDLYWFGWLERGAEGTRRFDRTPGALYPYLGAHGVEVCPSLNYQMANFKLKAEGAAYGYGYNIHLSPFGAERPVKMSAVAAPANLGVLADAAQVNTFQPPATPEHPMLEEFYYISTNEPTTHFRHRGRANLVFADSHVEASGAAPGTIDPVLPKERVGRLRWELLNPE